MDLPVRTCILPDMIAAIVNGVLGTLLTLGIGTWVLKADLTDLITCLLASNVASLISVLTTLQAERTPWIRKYFLNRSLKTWALLTGLYIGVMVSLAPYLRNPEPLLYLVLPLIQSTGFAILIFGPIQDRLVRRQQRKSCPN